LLRSQPSIGVGTRLLVDDTPLDGVALREIVIDPRVADRDDVIGTGDLADRLDGDDTNRRPLLGGALRRRIDYLRSSNYNHDFIENNNVSIYFIENYNVAVYSIADNVFVYLIEK